jgi:DnaJ-class molecular chaperone
MAEFYDPEPVDGGKAYGVAPPKPCPTCAGTGRMLQHDARNPRLIPTHVDCTRCGGTGRITTP